MENLITITVKSTHFYLIDFGQGKLLVDGGWVELMPRFNAELKKAQVRYDEIKYVMMTHHHPDHAGLIQTIKRLSGARLLIDAKQTPYLAVLAVLADYYQKNPDFEPVVVEKNDLVNPDRAALAAIGIRGEIVATPGHSPDSITLVLDSEMAFTGDLQLPNNVGEENLAETRTSWKKLAEMKAEIIYPGHGYPFHLSQVDYS